MARREFGEVFKRKARNGKMLAGWYVRWTDIYGKRHQRKAGDSKQEALDFLAEQRAIKRYQQVRGIEPVKKGSFRAIMPEVWPVLCVRWGDSTQRVNAELLKIVRAHFGNAIVKDIRQSHVEALLGRLKRERKIGPGGLRNYKNVLSAWFGVAVGLGYHDHNPAKSVRIEKAQEKPVIVLSVADQERLLRYADDEHRPLFQLILQTGLRVGEALNLCWQDVDARALTVRRSKGKRVRRINLTPLARDALGALRSRATIGMTGATLVWDGRNAEAVRRMLGLACERAGLPRVTTHGLRHTFATTMAEAGVPIPTLQKILGHQDVKTTMRYASHAPDSAELRAMERLAEFHRPSDSTTSSASRISSA